MKPSAIAIPHQFPAVIWWNWNDDSNAEDLHVLLESREEAEQWIKQRGHQWTRVSALIDDAFPGGEK